MVKTPLMTAYVLLLLWMWYSEITFALHFSLSFDPEPSCCREKLPKLAFLTLLGRRYTWTRFAESTNSPLFPGQREAIPGYPQKEDTWPGRDEVC